MAHRPAATLPISRDPNRHIDQAMAQLEKALGGREGIHAVLMQSDLTEQEELLVNLLADPQNDNRSLAKICGQAHLSITKFLDLFKRAKGAEAYAKSINRIYDRLPDIAGDIADRSVPQQARCKACRGVGLVKILLTDPEGEPILDAEKQKQWIEDECQPCEGTGQVTVLPDLERQKIALQLGGLLKDGKAIVQIDARQQAAIVQTNSSFRDATDRLLYGQPEPQAQEAEIVEEPE